tara:strand:- start:113 stop:514 length:402 start_codon:yes stop_codon:yes gene_type:complete
MVKTMERKETIGNVVYYAPTNIEQEDWLGSKTGRKATEITISEVLWHGKHNKFITHNGGANCACCHGERFRNANYKDYPIGVLAYECTKGEKYVVYSGLHRINKAIADGETTIKAYVYTEDELEKWKPYTYQS